MAILCWIITYKNRQNKTLREIYQPCFVLVEIKTENILGYYTLSANSISRDDFPQSIAQKLPPSYHALVTILLGRLVIDNNFKGNGYGELILLDALNRCVEISKSLDTLAVVVDPIDQ